MTKIADPRRVLLGWVVFLLLVIVTGSVLWPYGLGVTLNRMRLEFVAIGYLRTAQAEALGPPVRREEALAALNRAVELAPAHPLILENAAPLYVSLRAYSEAIPWLRRAANQDPLTLVSLGQCLLMTGQRAQGEALLQQVLQQATRQRQQGQMDDRVYALLLNNIGYVHALAGVRLEQAQKLLQMAVALAPRESAFVDSLGWAHYRSGDYLEATFDLERSVRLYMPRESAEMYYHLGAAYARLGHQEAARATLRRSLALDPSYTEAAEELRMLSNVLPAPTLACAGAVDSPHR